MATTTPTHPITDPDLTPEVQQARASTGRDHRPRYTRSTTRRWALNVRQSVR